MKNNIKFVSLFSLVRTFNVAAMKKIVICFIAIHVLSAHTLLSMQNNTIEIHNFSPKKQMIASDITGLRELGMNQYITTPLENRRTITIKEFVIGTEGDNVVLYALNDQSYFLKAKKVPQPFAVIVIDKDESVQLLNRISLMSFALSERHRYGLHDKDFTVT